jgi:hypothetical protein
MGSLAAPRMRRLVVAVSLGAALLLVLSSTGGASGRREGAGCPPSGCRYLYDVAWTVAYHARARADVKTDMAVTFKNVLVTAHLNTDTSTGKPVKQIEIEGGQLRNGRSPLTAKVVYDSAATGSQPACHWEKTYRRRVYLQLSASAAIDYKKTKKSPTGQFDVGAFELPEFDPDLSSLCEALQGYRLSLVVAGATRCTVIRGSGETCKVTGTKGFQAHGSGLAVEGSIEILPRQTLGRLGFPIEPLWHGKSFVIHAESDYHPPVRTSFSRTSVRIVFTRRKT